MVHILRLGFLSDINRFSVLMASMANETSYIQTTEHLVFFWWNWTFPQFVFASEQWKARLEWCAVQEFSICLDLTAWVAQSEWMGIARRVGNFSNTLASWVALFSCTFKSSTSNSSQIRQGKGGCLPTLYVLEALSLDSLLSLEFCVIEKKLQFRYLCCFPYISRASGRKGMSC